MKDEMYCTKKSRPVPHGMHSDNTFQSIHVGVEAGCFNSFAAIDHIILITDIQ